MFLLHTVKDTVRIAADSLAVNTVVAVQNEIDAKYPNRVLMDVGLVIGRYDCSVNPEASNTANENKSKSSIRANNSSSKRQRASRIPNGDGGLIRIGHGVCVTGDSGSHHDCTFQLIIFRPFVNEVCVGAIERSNADGIHVSLGFFNDIFIPAYWMLNPSYYDADTGLWVWTPQYDDDGNAIDDGGKESTDKANAVECIVTKADPESGLSDKEAEDTTNRYEMEIGSEIRFKVKAINFTQITNTAKGMQATTISMGSTNSARSSSDKGMGRQASSSNTDDKIQPLQRRRSSSVSVVDEVHALPSTMQIIGSICEDGLGLTSWWTSSQEEDDEEEEDGDGMADNGEADGEIADADVDGEYFEEYG